MVAPSRFFNSSAAASRPMTPLRQFHRRFRLRQSGFQLGGEGLVFGGIVAFDEDPDSGGPGEEVVGDVFSQRGRSPLLDRRGGQFSRPAERAGAVLAGRGNRR